MIDYHSGSVNYVYIGGSAELGHTGVVTCVLLDGKYLFSGSTDETIIAWSTDDDRKRVRTFVGHEGSIVSLAVEGTFLASGGSDSTLRLWDKHTGVQLRIVYGHSRSILSMEIGKISPHVLFLVLQIADLATTVLFTMLTLQVRRGCSQGPLTLKSACGKSVVRSVIPSP